jgi:hypothetical protein
LNHHHHPQPSSSSLPIGQEEDQLDDKIWSLEVTRYLPERESGEVPREESTSPSADWPAAQTVPLSLLVHDVAMASTQIQN